MRDQLNHDWLAEELQRLDWIVSVQKSEKLHIRRKAWRNDEVITVQQLYMDGAFVARTPINVNSHWIFHVNQIERRLACYEPLKMVRFYRANPKLACLDFQGSEYITFARKDYPAFVHKIRLK